MSGTSVPDTVIDNHRLRALLGRLGACYEATRWLDGRDAATAWAECPNGAWLLWTAARVGVDRRLVVRAAATCAETALRFVPEGEDRPRLAIEAARAWADDPNKEHRQRARQAADAAYALADGTTYDPADAAHAAAYAAAYAASAAATYAASYAARQETREETLARCADLVRARIPLAVVLDAAANVMGGRP